MIPAKLPDELTEQGGLAAARRTGNEDVFRIKFQMLAGLDFFVRGGIQVSAKLLAADAAKFIEEEIQNEHRTSNGRT